MQKKDKRGRDLLRLEEDAKIGPHGSYNVSPTYSLEVYKKLLIENTCMISKGGAGVIISFLVLYKANRITSWKLLFRLDVDDCNFSRLESMILLKHFNMVNEH